MKNYREERERERKSVKAALAAQGLKASVTHGRGTAANWLDVMIFGKAFNEAEYRQVLAVAASASGRTFRAAECIEVRFELAVSA